ncbi:MAG: phytanoyl-CoA dioxygenase family protein [Pseudomonadota bacterium]
MTYQITPAEIEEYQTRGFIHLRQVLDNEWLKVLSKAVERVELEGKQQPRVMNMTKLRRRLDSEAGRETLQPASNYIIAHNAWRWNDTLEHIAFNSPLPALAAELMGASQITWYFDQVFIKPPGSLLRTEFHQDLGYWTCKGEQICTFWAPTDPVRLQNGAMGYVPGSHRWDENFKANMFVGQQPIPGQEGDDLPDIAANEHHFGVDYIECEPGDVIVHHVKTIHGSAGNMTADAPRRSIAFRYTGDDVVYRTLPGLPPDSTPVSDTLKDGDPLESDLFPRIWTQVDANS